MNNTKGPFMIKFIVMDVDGTLTDGKINISDSGELFKSFNIKDGCGIKDILPKYDIEPVIITARNSNALKKRCDELNIKFLFQSIRNKIEKLYELINKYNDENQTDYSLQNVAYIGDDILDIQCMRPIKNAGGIVGCPNDAVTEVKELADFIAVFNGGDGAVRDFIDYIVKEKVFDRRKADEFVEMTINYLLKLDLLNMNQGRYIINDDIYFLVQEYETKNIDSCKFENHRHHIDIQWIIDGEERIDIEDSRIMFPMSDYDEQKDVIFLKPTASCSKVILKTGSYVVLYPNNAHRPCICVNEPVKIKKVVCKIGI